MNSFIFILFITFYCASGDFGLQLLGNTYEESEPYCFLFSWLGPTINEQEIEKINCSHSKYDHTPCIKPIIASLSPPNHTDIWYKNRTAYTCALQPGSTCIKYTYLFNGGIVNSSYYCGKMIQDTVSVVEKGCFTQKAGGYVIQTCSCQTKGLKNQMPCNSSIRNHYSFLSVVLSFYLLLYKL